MLKLLIKQRLLWKIITIFWLMTFLTILANIYITKEIAFSEFKSEHFKEKTNALGLEAVELYESEGLKALRKWYRQVYRKEGLRVSLLDEQLNAIGKRESVKEDSESEYKLFSSPSDLHKHLLNLADQEITSISGNTYLFRILPSPALRAKFNPDTLHLYRFLSSFLIIFLGSLWLYRSIATPLKILHEASSKLSVGDFSVRTKPAIGSRKDELGQLACAFDQMAIKIEALLTNQKQLFRDISHEIRTPLTRQKLALELAKDSPNPLEYLTQIERQNSHIDTLVNNLLTFMRLEDTPITEYETVDLNNMLDDLINEAELDAQSKKLDIKKQLEQNSLVQCNYILLLRAFENILMNAIKYSPDGSQILVKTWRTNGKVCASISDQGFGIPEEDLENILKPFYRADQSRNQQSGGYGLGLAITEKIIKQHHGSLIIKNLTPHGLEVTIELDAIE